MPAGDLIQVGRKEGQFLVKWDCSTPQAGHLRARSLLARLEGNLPSFDRHDELRPRPNGQLPANPGWPACSFHDHLALDKTLATCRLRALLD